MCNCNTPLYIQIGLLISSIGFAVFAAQIFHYIFNGCREYVTESKYVKPKWIEKIYLKCGGQSYADPIDMFMVSFCTLLISFAIVIMWPLFITTLVIYAFLRMLRFTYRIKTSIKKLTSSKKCLKDHKEVDIKI